MTEVSNEILRHATSVAFTIRDTYGPLKNIIDDLERIGGYDRVVHAINIFLDTEDDARVMANVIADTRLSEKAR